MEISGRIKVKAKVSEVTGQISYRTVLTQKNTTGEPIFATLFITFVGNAKNMPVDNDQFIIIKKGFLSFNIDKDEKTQFRLVIQDFDYDALSITPVESDGSDLPF